MNKQPRYVDFNNARNLFYQNSRTYDERLSKQIITVYKSIDDSNTKIEKVSINLEIPITVDSLSEVVLESFQVSTMNDNTETTAGNKGSYIHVDTLGFILDIKEFDIKAGSNIAPLRDKIFVPYTNYMYNAVTEKLSGQGSGFSYYNNPAPLKNNYVCTINPQKLHNLTLSVSRLQAGGSVGSDPDEKDIFSNEGYDENNVDLKKGGDIMLTFSITNLPGMMMDKSNIDSVFMNPQNNLMNIPNEYEQMMLKQKQEDEMKQYYNRQ